MTLPKLPVLNGTQVRILGALIEKESTTPDAYPLSLNALTHACNQSTNRDPVVEFTESEVEHELESLRRNNLVRRVERGEARVPRYRHVVDEALSLDRPALAVLAMLMLRGHQTAGEIRSRCQRVHDFPDLADLDSVLSTLRSREPDALVVDLPRRPGQKEIRFTHRLGDQEEADALSSPVDDGAGEAARIAQLEVITAELQHEVSRLRDQLDQFRKQFD
jgi:hypothetical protein